MTAIITKDPGVTEAGELRRYAIEVKDNDWPAFAELVEDLDGEKVSVTVDGAVFNFQTTRERLSWADGFRTGEKFAANAAILVDWLEAWLKEQTQTDLMEKEAASRRVALCAAKMSPTTQGRAVALAKALTRWQESSPSK